MPAAGDPVKITDSFLLNTFTPVWTALSIGTGAINEGWWNQQGSIVNWGFRLQLGTAPSGAGTTIQIDLPVNAWVGGGNSLQAAVGVFNIRDASTVNQYPGTLTVFSSGGGSAAFSLPTGNTRWNSSTPMAVAVDDIISGSGTYRAA